MKAFQPRARANVMALAIGLMAAGLASLEAANSPQPFGDGERWCVLGDSITHYGSYHQWIDLFYATRFPGRSVEVFNCGISGDTAQGALQRFAWDVAPLKPTVVSVMFGMNDVGRELYGKEQFGMEVVQRRKERLAIYGATIRSLVREIQNAGARAILITPSIYDQTGELTAANQPGVNEALGECARLLREIAEETEAALVDVHGPMTRANAALQSTNAKATIVSADRIHPEAPGHLFIAYQFLKSQGVTGVVSRLAIDLNSNAVTAADNGIVSNIVRDENSLTFEWLEKSLPFPIDPAVSSALAWVPFGEEFNQETLQVVGLPAGRYVLDIDGESVGAFAANELAAGINLAVFSDTPQYEQAQRLLDLVRSRAELERDNIRGLAHVEHQLAPELERPVTLEQMQPYLQQRLEAFASDPPAPSTQQNFELYPRRKGNEEETLATMRRMERLSQVAASPISHIYRLRRVQ